MLRLRYKLSEVLMIIGIALGMIVSFHTFSIVSLFLPSQKSTSFQNSRSYWVYSSDISKISNENGLLSYFTPNDIERINLDSLLGLLSNMPGHKEIAMLLPIGDSADDRRAIGVMEVSSRPHKLKSGTWEIEGTDGFAGLIWIGESWEPYVVKKGNCNVLLIDSLEYKIQGVLDNYLTGGIDETIIIFLPFCSKQAMASIENNINRNARSIGDIELSFYSDDDKGFPDVEKLKMGLAENGLATMNKFFAYHSEAEESRALHKPLVVVVFSIVVFSAINLFVVSSFYYTTRQSELSIRKVFGIRGRSLCRLLITDICKLFFYSLVCVFSVEGIMILCNSDMAIRADNFLSLALICLLSFVILLLFLFVRFLIMFKRIQPRDLLMR